MHIRASWSLIWARAHLIRASDHSIRAS